MASRPATLLIAVLISACSYGDAKGIAVAGDYVHPIALNLSGNCESIEGSYDDEGVALRRQVVQSPRLAHSLFRLALLGEDGYPVRPSSVRLSIDRSERTLLVTVAGAGSLRKWSTLYECRDGWMHVRDEQGKQYLGDGVTQLWSARDISLVSDVEGNLVAHTVGKSEDRAFLGGRRSSHGEGWYLFRRQGGIDQDK